jgi:hypothetical protein
MSRNEEQRVLIAITESCPLEVIWRAAVQRLPATGAGLTAVYVAESHWHRAASLPFTREISRVSGTNVDFTPQRASEVREAAVDKARAMIRRLATDEDLSTAFEVLSDSDWQRIRELVRGTSDLLIAPAIFRRQPIFAEFEKLGCRIELVEAEGDAAAPETG